MRDLNTNNTFEPWYKNAIFYELYVRAFCDSNADGHGDLEGVIQKLDYLAELGVDCLWLMPIYPSPLKDDGYDVADYYNILPQYGTLEDFKKLLEAAHQRGMRVINDLVLNHTSDQHPWFQEARANLHSPYRGYYVWSDDRTKYAQARVIFLDSETSNWAWDEVAQKYYWHRFYRFQPDLNFDNPKVQEEMLRVVDFWLGLGVDGFRVDAVPYLFEREGTHCENLPETHAYLKRLRKFVDEKYPGRLLLCEANQWPKDVRHYFGEGDEFHMGFHFPLMPRLFMALRKADKSPLEWVFEQTPPIPENCQWCTFLRNHDELTLEMVTEEERAWMWQEYAPDPRMRLNLGIRRRLAPLLDNDARKIELAYSLLFTLPGSPVIYYGDEIGMGDNIWLPDRNGVRTPMQWNSTLNAGFSQAPPNLWYAPLIDAPPYSPAYVNVELQRQQPHSLFQVVRRMIRIRKDYPVLGIGRLDWVAGVDASLAAYWRRCDDQRLLILNNLSDKPHAARFESSELRTMAFEDLFTHQVFTTESGICSIEMDGYQYRWLKVVRD